MHLKIALFAALTMIGTAALAEDIVTMPTANQAKKGQVSLGLYYLDFNLPAGAPRFAQYQTLYLGLTSRLEVDFHRAAIDNDATSVVTVASYKLLSENATNPDLVVGVRNLFNEATTNNPAMQSLSRTRSYYAAAAKTFFLKPNVQGPPLVRWHMGMGSRDWTLLGESRHEGVFGGLQFLFHPVVGAVIEHDGRDWISALTFIPPKSGLVLKLGTFGKHSWYGLEYSRTLF